MKTLTRFVVAVELTLIFPAVFFMASLLVRDFGFAEFGPARLAGKIVEWYTSGPVWLTLWLLLMAFPLTAVALGSAMLVRLWRYDVELRQAVRQTITGIRTHLAALLMMAATVTATIIVAIVAVHAGAN